MITLSSVKTRARKKLGAIVLFVSSVILGTSAPILISRCAGAGGCGSCGGFCSTAAIGIVPLVLVFVFKDKVKLAWRSFMGLFKKMEDSSN